MTLRENILYHQIHPAKLLTDCGSSFASSWLLWEAHWTEAGLVAFLPSIAITLILLVFGDLDRYRETPFGNYVARCMTRKIEVARLAGQLVVWSGAVAHVFWILPFGYFVIALAWANGLWVSNLAGDEGV